MERNRHLTLWLAGIIAVIFLLQVLFPVITADFVLKSSDVFSRPWILITAIFLHAGITHLVFNGFALLMFGSILEELIGSRLFAAVFVVAGVVSSVASAFIYSSVLGASGAIFGILGALTVLRPNMTVWVYYLPMPMYMAAAVWAITDLFGFIVTTNVANAGHLAGLAAGIVAGFLIRGRKPLFSGRGGFGSRQIITAEEFDKWEKENMGKK